MHEYTFMIVMIWHFRNTKTAISHCCRSLDKNYQQLLNWQKIKVGDIVAFLTAFSSGQMEQSNWLWETQKTGQFVHGATDLPVHNSTKRLRVFLKINYSDKVYVIMFRQPEHNYFCWVRGSSEETMCWWKREYYYTLHLHLNHSIVLGTKSCGSSLMIWSRLYLKSAQKDALKVCGPRKITNSHF